VLVPFGRDKLDREDPELVRDLAVGLLTHARSQPEPVRASVSRAFAPALARAVAAHPEDISARECLGVALAWQGRLTAALEACEETLARVPRREAVLCDAGVVAQRLNLPDGGLEYWQRALAVNPSAARYRFEVAKILSDRGDWDRAVAECRRVLAVHGTHANSRLLLMQDYLRRGMKAQARAELETALALRPPNEAQLRQMFADLLR
jgi:tetratricopeptide (TPR) repeat protein